MWVGLAGILVAVVLVLLVSAVVIYIVGRLGLGMTVDGFGSAFALALVVAVVTGVLQWLMSIVGVTIVDTNLLGAILALIVSALILMIAGSFTQGVKVNGFTGAIVAALGIGVVSWLLGWIVGLFG